MALSNERYPENHPDGIYVLKVIGQALANGKDETKPPYLKLKCEVVKLKKGSEQGVVSKFGSHRYCDLYFTEKTIERTKGLLQAAGFKGKSLSQLDPDNSEHISIVGFEFDATNNKQLYTGDDPKYKGKKMDKFSALSVGGGDKNAWISKLNRPKTVAMMKLDALFNSNTGAPSVTASQLAAQQPSKPASQDTDEAPW